MIENTAAQNLLFSVAGIICLYSTVKSLRTGSASIATVYEFKRTENPVSYWMAVAFSASAFLASLFLLVASLFGLKV